MAPLPFLFYLLALSLYHPLFPGGEATTFTIVNNCQYTVWPGILSNAGVPTLSTTGFALKSGKSTSIKPASGWGGRFWGRTSCTTDPTGKFTCQSGDCGSGQMDCSGAGAIPPATLAEFTLDGSGGMDFYDVSLVDGYNLPMLVAPSGGGGLNCSFTGCVVDVNGACPTRLRLMSSIESGGNTVVGCKSACDAFNSPEYCCSGEYQSPTTCKPSSYSLMFKNACPRAYSYAYDDKSSTFTCGGSPDYTITFCPSPNSSQKAAASSSDSDDNDENETGSPSSPDLSSTSIMNGTMVYEGALDESSAPYTCINSIIVGGLLIFVIMLL